MLYYYKCLAPPGVCAHAWERLGVSGVCLGIFLTSEVRPSVLPAPGSGGSLAGRLAWLVLPEVGGCFFLASDAFLWGLVAHFFRLDFHQQKEISKRPGRLRAPGYLASHPAFSIVK